MAVMPESVPIRHAGARNGRGCEAIRHPNIQRSNELSTVHIERIHYPMRKTVHSVTSYDRRPNNICGGLPALVHMTACVNRDLQQTIGAGNKDRRADGGCATKRVTHRLLIERSPNTTELLRVQEVAVAGFTCCKDEIPWQQHRSLRTQVRVVCVILPPACWRERILEVQGGRELQHRIAVIPLAAGDRTVADRDVEISRCVDAWPSGVAQISSSRGVGTV